MSSISLPLVGNDRSWQNVAVATAGVVTATFLTYNVTSRWLGGRRVEKTRQRRQEECRRQLDELSVRVNERLRQNQKMSQAEIERITTLPVKELLSELHSRRISSTEVLTAFQSQAMVAHVRTGCLVEPIAEAEDAAAAFDDPTVVPTSTPLHGLPVSIKESYSMKGYQATYGVFSLLGQKQDEDCVLVKVLKAQGGVPYVRTNLPYMALNYTCRNPVYGNATNPHDTTRGPGGSSGGEGALLALNGSPLGLGSDIGGSIRNPCHFCGIAGLKPTSNRLSLLYDLLVSTPCTKLPTLVSIDVVSAFKLVNCRDVGRVILKDDLLSIPVCLGPMARDVDTLVIAMKALLVPLLFQLDRAVPPITFRNEIYSDDRPLRIGYYFDTGLFQPDPSCQRAVNVAKDILEKQGKHKLVPWNLPPEVTSNFRQNYRSILLGDTGKSSLKLAKGDKPVDNMALLVIAARMPVFIRKLMAFVLQFVDKEQSSALIDTCGARDVSDWWQKVEEIETIRYAFDTAAWEAAGLDAVICPAFSCPAMPNDLVLPVEHVGCELQIYNLLDVPAGVLPVTKVTAEDIRKLVDYPDSTKGYRAIKKGMQGAEGLPIGVQVVAPRYQEELCLRVMKEIETGVRELAV